MTALAWNTQKLLEKENNETFEEGQPVEYHFLSNRTLYDCSIEGQDVGKWVVFGNRSWYTVETINWPHETLPQELCLSFDCFRRAEEIGVGTTVGPEIDEIAIELGALLSLLSREPIIPLGIRRIDDTPVRMDASQSYYLQREQNSIHTCCGINSKDLRDILEGIANGQDDNTSAIISATKLYHSAILLSNYDTSTAYLSLVSAIECLAGHYLRDYSPAFHEIEKFRHSNNIIEEISSQINDATLIDKLKRELRKNEHFSRYKFRSFIENFLPSEFWEPDDLYPEGCSGMPAIAEPDLKRFLMKIYDARSKFAHEGQPFPAYVSRRAIDKVTPKQLLQSVSLDNEKPFVPVFPWFERLTNFALREYLIRVIAPSLNDKRQKRYQYKEKIMVDVQHLPKSAQDSLRRLLEWYEKLLFHRVVGPRARNADWAVDEHSIGILKSKGLIVGNGETMDGDAIIMNREIAEAAGEFFYGPAKNPFKGNTLFPSRPD